jgi:hypothetical protein
MTTLDIRSPACFHQDLLEHLRAWFTMMWAARSVALVLTQLVVPFSLCANLSIVNCKAENSQIDHIPRYQKHESITITFCSLSRQSSYEVPQLSARSIEVRTLAIDPNKLQHH